MTEDEFEQAFNQAVLRIVEATRVACAELSREAGEPFGPPQLPVILLATAQTEIASAWATAARRHTS